MSSEVWKIGQAIKASDYYKKIEENGFDAGIIKIKGEVVAVNQLANICNQMISSYDEITQDQNEYLLTIENESLNIENAELEAQEKINKLMQEIRGLEKKKDDGTITDEEKQELEGKYGELTTLNQGADAKVQDANSKIDNAKEKAISYQDKIKVASNYGEVTVEKGTPLSETHVSSGFFKKLFGSTGKDKKEAGDRAVAAGKELLENVAESKSIEADIKQKVKKAK